ncbi:MAG: tetratricopeptide repeat protein [Deltaproteobacteria bacterium]|nr:tetratricopeptide repeat protein [Deltaproteobacteria bacterium]
MLNILASVFALLSFVSFIMFIIVLVKLFKNEGILKGIFGIICGIYTFVWGWKKHRSYNLTKYMTVWTASFVLSLLLQAAVVVFIGHSFSGIAGLIPGAVSPGGPKVVQRSVKRAPRPLPPPSKQGTPQQGTVKDQTATAGPQVSTGAAASKGEKEIDFLFEMKKVESLLKVNPNRADAHYDRGWLNAYRGNFQEALADYTKAIELDKNFADAYFNRGLVLARLGKHEQAVKDFTEAARLMPRNADVYCNRGSAYFEMKKLDLALQDYTKALELAPGDGDILYNRAKVYEAMGEEEKARADLIKAARLKHEKTLKSYPQLTP